MYPCDNGRNNCAGRKLEKPSAPTGNRRSTRKEHINTVRVSCSIQPRQIILPKNENGGLLPELADDAPPAHCLSQHLQRVIPWCPSEEGTGPVEECPGQVFCLFSLKRSHREVHTGTAEAVHGDPHTQSHTHTHTHTDTTHAPRQKHTHFHTHTEILID